MTPDDEAEIVELMRQARLRDRGYASFFGWQIDRDLEELGVLKSLAESLEADGKVFFDQIQIRGRGMDPPDLEARDLSGERLAFEITELVDGEAVKAYKAGRTYDWAEWSKDKFIRELGIRLSGKAKRFPVLKGAPYPGGYVVVVFTDEQELRHSTVREFLARQVFTGIPEVARAFLVLSYDPALERCPYFELQKDA